MNRYPIGNLVRLRGQVKDVDGNLADPAVVKCTVKNPSGQKTTYVAPDVVNDSVGVYHLDITASAIGSWSYRWYSAGLVKAARSGLFLVVA